MRGKPGEFQARRDSSLERFKPGEIQALLEESLRWKFHVNTVLDQSLEIKNILVLERIFLKEVRIMMNMNK